MRYKTKPLDELFERITSFEFGELDTDEIVILFQDLVDDGIVWELQGNYGRLAARLLKTGEVVATTTMAQMVRDA